MVQDATQDVLTGVVSATGRRGTYIAWRKVGRLRLGIGIGAPPVEPA